MHAAKTRQPAPAAHRAPVRPSRPFPAASTRPDHAQQVRQILSPSGIQAKLSVGRPDDAFEQEADRAADRVLSGAAVGSVGSLSAAGSSGDGGANSNPAGGAQSKAGQPGDVAGFEQVSSEREAQPEEGRVGSGLLTPGRFAADGGEDDGQGAQAKLLQLQPEEGEDEEVQAKAEAGSKQLKYVVNADAPDQEPKAEVQAKAEINRQEDEEPQLQGKQASPVSGQASSVVSMLNSSKGGGSPLPPNVRSEMESQFSADFSGVRIHTGGAAVAMSGQIHAQAFTHGGDIYFNEGKYDPGSSAGRHLLAHELTHTIQQGAAQQRDSNPTPIQKKADERIQRSWLGRALDAVGDAVSAATDFVAQGLDAALNYAKGLFSDFAQGIPGYKLLSVALGQDPVTGATVERNGINFIEAGLDIIPFGDSFRRKLGETGKLQEAAAWLDERMKSLDGISLSAILANLAGFWRSLSIEDIADIPAVLERAANIIRDPIARIVAFCGDVASYFLTLIKNHLLRELSDFVGRQQQARGFPLLTVILGRNPITDEEVPRNGMNLIRGFMLLSADGQEQLRQMEESGSLQRAADWIDTSVANLGLAWEGIKNAFAESWALVTIENLFTNPRGTFLEIVGKFTAPVTIILNFVIEVGRMILHFIKEALLSRLSAHAREARGYTLLTVILGRDPFTGAAVERNAENLIHGFMGLMEGGEEQFQEMKQSGAIDRMTDRIERAVATLNFTWDYITGLFLAAWNSFSLQDLAAPFAAFARIVSLFADPLLRLFGFVVEVVKIAIEVALQLMEFPFALINNIIAKSVQAFNDIKRDPIGFLKNLLRAVKTGFVQFFDNIGTHLLNGVTGWLFKELGDAGISPPADFSLRSILGLVFDVLGISMDKIFQKLAAKIGQEKVDRIRAMGERLTGAWAFISDVMERGPVAIWEYVQEKLSNLWNMVLEVVSNWIVTRIISQVTAKLLSMLDPTGIMAVVNGFIAFFKAVQSFIAYLREMLEIVNSFVEGVAEVAAGNVTSAANYLEGALARAMPVAIGFLANQVGLGGLGRRIGEMIGRVQEKVDEGIDWLIDKAMSAGSTLLSMGRAAVGAVRNWWNTRETLTTRDGQHHEITFTGSGGSSNLVIRSTPTPYDRYLNNLESQHGLTSDQTRFARNKAREIEVEKNCSVPEDQKEEQGRRIHALVVELADLTRALPLHGSTTSTPPIYGPLINGYGSMVTISRLTDQHGQGSPPGDTSSDWQTLVRRIEGTVANPGGRSLFVRGHLLNDNLGGPGTWENLTPLTQSANNTGADSHLHGFEADVKEAVNDNHKEVDFRVTAEYGRPFNSSLYQFFVSQGNEEDNVRAQIVQAEQCAPRALRCISHEVDASGNPGRIVAEHRVDNTFVQSVDSYPLSSGAPKVTVYLSGSEMDKPALMELNGIGDALADRIIAARPFRTKFELQQRAGIAEGRWQQMQSTPGKIVRMKRRE